jgi:hypothetical protein
MSCRLRERAAGAIDDDEALDDSGSEFSASKFDSRGTVAAVRPVSKRSAAGDRVASQNAVAPVSTGNITAQLFTGRRCDHEGDTTYDASSLNQARESRWSFALPSVAYGKSTHRSV